jgi:hypothetical protein
MGNLNSRLTSDHFGLIYNYLSGDLSKEKMKEVDDWKSENDRNQELFDYIKNIYSPSDTKGLENKLD